MNIKRLLFPLVALALLASCKEGAKTTQNAQEEKQTQTERKTEVTKTEPIPSGDKKYIDVSGENPEGKTIALSDYVGKNKLVLIDFWASWCPPCVKEMPNLVKAYDSYKDKGFEIVGISLDDKKNSWVDALGKLNMTWPQMSDLKGWESKLSAPYGVKSIPHTLLVNENGEIIASDLRGDELANLLAKYLN